MQTLLDLSLSVDYGTRRGVLDGVEFSIHRGEIFGLVGESGSGKSTIAMAILGLLGYRGGAASGKIVFDSQDLLVLRQKQLRHFRGKEIALVLQSPLLALNPAVRIETSMKEAWRAHGKRLDGWRERALECFEMVSLPHGEEMLTRYPRQLSVGQAQRVVIAMAILHRPQLLIADESTSALDAITQAEILKLFRHLSGALNMSVLFISHDLASLATICDTIGVLHTGKLVECGPTRELFDHPSHPYTRALLAAVPRFGSRIEADLDALARHVSAESVPVRHSTSVSATSFSTLTE